MTPVTDPTVNPSGPSDETSPSLLDRIRAADPAAWKRLVDLYGPLVYGWCLRAGLQPADAADVGQEVFLAVAGAIHRFRRDRPGDTFRGWLYTIARNKLRDHGPPAAATGLGGDDGAQRMARLPAPGNTAPDAEPPPDPDGDRLLFRRAVELVRGEFEPQTWAAFWATAVEDRSPADVAAALGTTPNAVYLAKSRVLHRLRAEFTDVLRFEENGST